MGEWSCEGGLVEAAVVAPTPSQAIFLDRDGTLIRDVGYLSDPAKVRWLPGVMTALRRLQEGGFSLVIVSNQSGIGRGLSNELQLRQVHDRMLVILGNGGIVLAGAWYCTHAPDDDCACRKPRPGMLKRAAERLGLVLSASWMVGDKESDVEAGRAAGCRSLRLDGGTPDLVTAANFILTKGDAADHG